MNNIHVHRMPSHASEFRRCLVDCDVDAILRLWAHVEPSMPKPETKQDALIVLHICRTASERIPFRFRAYSHRWLADHVPVACSQLPNELRPKAEKMYPNIVSGAMICVADMNNRKTDYHRAVQKALCDVVEEFYADGKQNDEIAARARMKEIHDKMRKMK